MKFGKVEQKTPKLAYIFKQSGHVLSTRKIVFESQGTQKEKVKTLASPRRYTN